MDMYNGSNGWDHTGWRCGGFYLGEFAFSGVVDSSRVAYGGKVRHTIVLDTPIEVFGAIREVIIMNHDEVAFFELAAQGVAA